MPPMTSGCGPGPGRANSPSQSRTADQAALKTASLDTGGAGRALRNPGNLAWAGVGGVVSEDARVSATPPDGAVECRLWRLRAAEIEPVIVLPRSVPGAGRPGLLPQQPPVRSAEPPGRGRLPLAARRPACAASPRAWDSPQASSQAEPLLLLSSVLFASFGIWLRLKSGPPLRRTCWFWS